MATSTANAWDRTRQTFADQFEEDGPNFIYRRSQKGQAIRVSAQERANFLGEFDANIRRSKWIMYVGVSLALCGAVLFSLIKGSNSSEPLIVAAIVLGIVPYFAFFRWAWAAPARELENRVPIAGERPREEVLRLQFQRMTYGQLATAAGGGLLIPFVGSSRQDVFSGWNRLWLVFGGALILFAAVQAFRKWRFEQEDSSRNIIRRPFERRATEPAQESTPPAKNQLWRYLPFAVLLLGIAFIASTPAGKQLAKQPSFWPILMGSGGAWALFTVWRGFSKRQIEPFARGFYNTYNRDTQPKRFWASMAWNFTLGCGCLVLAFVANHQDATQSIQDHCYNSSDAYLPEDALSACDQLIRESQHDSNAFFGRGYAYERLGKPQRAIPDLTEVVRLTPDNANAFYDRGVAYKQIGDTQHATADFEVAFRLDPRLCHGCAPSSR